METFSYSRFSQQSCYITLSVVLVQLNLFPSFSGYNTLYRLLEASQELTVLHFLLPTPVAFLLLFLYAFPNNFWLCGPTSHTRSMSYLLPYLHLYPLHLGLSLDLFDLLLYQVYFLLLFLCILLPFSTLFVPLFPHMILLLLAVHFSLGTPHSSPVLSLLLCFVSGFCLVSLPFLATLQWWLMVPLLQLTSF